MDIYHAHFEWAFLEDGKVGLRAMFIECKIDTVYGEYPFLVTW